MSLFGAGLPEMAVIAGLGLLVFGPRKLPELGRTLGKTLKGLQSASREFEQEFSRALQERPDSTDPSVGEAEEIRSAPSEPTTPPVAIDGATLPVSSESHQSTSQ